MNILYNEEKTQTDRYDYFINTGGDLDIQVDDNVKPGEHTVTIVFVNGKLSSTKHYLTDQGEKYLRSNWYILGAIAEKIKELEKRYKSTYYFPVTDEKGKVKPVVSPVAFVDSCCKSCRFETRSKKLEPKCENVLYDYQWVFPAKFCVFYKEIENRE